MSQTARDDYRFRYSRTNRIPLRKVTSKQLGADATDANGNPIISHPKYTPNPNPRNQNLLQHISKMGAIQEGQVKEWVLSFRGKKGSQTARDRTK